MRPRPPGSLPPLPEENSRMASSIDNPVFGPDRDRLEKAYYEAVGHALSTWMQAEGWMSSLYCSSFDEVSYVPARYTFAQIQSVEQKLRAINASFGSEEISEFPRENEFRAYWRKLRKKFKNANEFRNKLAHGKVTYLNHHMFFDPFPWGNDIPVIELALAAKAKGKQYEHTTPPSHAIPLEDIQDYQKNTSGLYGDFRAFSELLHFRKQHRRE